MIFGSMYPYWIVSIEQDLFINDCTVFPNITMFIPPVPSSIHALILYLLRGYNIYLIFDHLGIYICLFFYNRDKVNYQLIGIVVKCP